MAIRALIRRRETESELEVVDGEGANAARLEELYARAEHEVCLFDSPPYLAPRTPQLDLQADLLERGVSYRSVYAATALEDPDVLWHALRSLRTLRRRVSDLQERLGAASRFQLGVRAGGATRLGVSHPRGNGEGPHPPWRGVRPDCRTGSLTC